MRQVYLAGRALISALGPDLPSALARLNTSSPSWEKRLNQQQSIPSPPPLRAGKGNTQSHAEDCKQVPGDTFTLTSADGEPSHWPYRFIATEHKKNWPERAFGLIQSAIDQIATPPDRHAPLLIGTTSGDIGAFETEPIFEQDSRRFARQIAERLRWQGPVCTINTACTSSLNALISAQRRIAAGSADNALVLGVELFNFYTVRGFAGMQLLSPHRALPFGCDRDGLVLGEAVTALYLSATPQRWRLNAGTNHVDGSDPMGADANTIVALFQQTLDAAGLSATDVDLIKVQAAGSPRNDAVEADALHHLFSTLPPLISFKAALGHTLGAAGAAELALLIACLENNICPAIPYSIDPTLGLTLALSFPTRIRNILHAVYGFGGGYAALALEDTEART